jgi:LysM repeat protein
MRLAPPMEQPARWQGAPYPGTADGRPPGTHVIVVREGDTLYSLSRHYRVSLADIIAANRLDHGKIEIGQRLAIPPSRYALVGPRG